MKLLFCKPKYIGDTLLLTATVRAVKARFPDAAISVLTRPGCEGILSGCPGIDEVLTLPRRGDRSRLKADLSLIAALRRRRFDIAFELGDGDRGRILTLLSGARRKVANTHPVHMKSALWRGVFGGAVRNDYNTPGVPRALWDFRTVSAVLGVPGSDPTPVFERDRADFGVAKELAGDRRPLFVHPAASVAEKMWPEARWSELLSDLSATHDIVLSSGPAASEREYCERILKGVRDPSRIRGTGGRLSWPEMAGLLYSSRAYIGADTAAMHLASACRIPILGLFGHNGAEHLAQWSPPGERVRIVTFSGDETGIASIPVSRVLDALEQLDLS